MDEQRMAARQGHLFAELPATTVGSPSSAGRLDLLHSESPVAQYMLLAQGLKEEIERRKDSCLRCVPSDTDQSEQRTLTDQRSPSLGAGSGGPGAADNFNLTFLETQSTTLNIGSTNQFGANASYRNTPQFSSTPKSSPSTKEQQQLLQHHYRDQELQQVDLNIYNDASTMDNVTSSRTGTSSNNKSTTPTTTTPTTTTTTNEKSTLSNQTGAASCSNSSCGSGNNCQVCLVKNMQRDLLNMNKIVRERNDQIREKLRNRRLRSFFEQQM